MVSEHIEANRLYSFDMWNTEPQVKHADTIASSERLGWRGVDLRLGINDGCDIDAIMLDGHFVGIQLNDDAIPVRTRKGADWCELYNPPRSVWIQPYGSPFSMRHSVRSRWAGVVIQPQVLEATLGWPHNLREGYAVSDDLLAHLFSSLITQVTSDKAEISANLKLSEALTRSFLLALCARHGTPAPQNGGIPPYKLRALRVWLEENISGKLSVEAMARRLDLSPGHFAREFKRSTSLSPWDYVVQLRADTAQRLIEEGERASVVALRCGFADQAHLSRVLKARFGHTASALRRRPN